jgi:hypothetical protein
MRERARVIHCRKGSFTDDGGRQVEYAQITFCGMEPTSKPDEKGSEVQKCGATVNVYGALQQVPGVYDLEVTLRDGKARVTGATWVPPQQPAAK